MVKRSKTLVVSAILAGFYLFAGMIFYMVLQSDRLPSLFYEVSAKALQSADLSNLDEEVLGVVNELKDEDRYNHLVNSQEMGYVVTFMLSWVKLHLLVWAAGFTLHFFAVWQRSPLLALLAAIAYILSAIIGFTTLLFTIPIIVFTFIGRRNQHYLRI